MTDAASSANPADQSSQDVSPAVPVIDEQLARRLVDEARTKGVSLVGPGGLLGGLTKTVLETALEAEMTEHLGYEPHDRGGSQLGQLP